MWQNRDQDMILCPYNRYHVVSKLRIQKHLIKCQKNYPNVKLATCFYNFTHRLKPEDMLKHYEICSHKTRVEGARYYEPGTYNPIDSSVSDDRSFSFPKTAAKTQNHFYNPCKVSEDLPKTDFDFKASFGASNSDKDDSLLNMDKENIRDADLIESDDEDDDDMTPLPLPKTVSKAFTCLKQRQEECSTNTHPCETSQARGFGRAKNLLRCSPPTLPKTTDHLLPGVSDMEIILPENKFPKFISRSVTTNSNVEEPVFDDTNTLKSQDIVFDEDDDDNDNDGFILKNFDN